MSQNTNLFHGRYWRHTEQVFKTHFNLGSFKWQDQIFEVILDADLTQDCDKSTIKKNTFIEEFVTKHTRHVISDNDTLVCKTVENKAIDLVLLVREFILKMQIVKMKIISFKIQMLDNGTNCHKNITVEWVPLGIL